MSLAFVTTTSVEYPIGHKKLKQLSSQIVPPHRLQIVVREDELPSGGSPSFRYWLRWGSTIDVRRGEAAAIPMPDSLRLVFQAAAESFADENDPEAGVAWLPPTLPEGAVAWAIAAHQAQLLRSFSIVVPERQLLSANFPSGLSLSERLRHILRELARDRTQPNPLTGPFLATPTAAATLVGDFQPSDFGLADTEAATLVVPRLLAMMDGPEVWRIGDDSPERPNSGWIDWLAEYSWPKEEVVRALHDSAAELGLSLAS